MAKLRLHIILAIAFSCLGCNNNENSNKLDDVYYKVSNDLASYYQQISSRDTTKLISDLATIDSLDESIYEHRGLVHLKMTIYNELGRKNEALLFLSEVPDSILQENTVMNGKTYTIDGKIVRVMTEGFFADTESKKIEKYNQAANMLENYLETNVDENALMKYIGIKSCIVSKANLSKMIDEYEKTGRYQKDFLDMLRSVNWEDTTQVEVEVMRNN